MEARRIMPRRDLISTETPSASLRCFASIKKNDTGSIGYPLEQKWQLVRTCSVDQGLRQQNTQMKLTVNFVDFKMLASVLYRCIHTAIPPGPAPIMVHMKGG